MFAIQPVSLEVNCGFARTAIFEYSPTSRGCNARAGIDKDTRVSKFKAMFSSSNNCNYSYPDKYFECTRATSLFDRHCTKILDGIAKKWPEGTKQRYLSKFSVKAWCELPTEEKLQHTFGHCRKCHDKYESLQMAFPLKPIYTPPSNVTIDCSALKRQGVKKFTRKALVTLDNIYQTEVGTSFAEAVTTDRQLGLQQRMTKSDKKQEKRKTQRTFTKVVNQRFAENAAISLLVEGESKRQYHRKRISQSFTSPQPGMPPAKKQKSHSPSIGTTGCDTSQLADTLQTWPENTPINWSAVAREHDIQVSNGGQVVKEFAKQQGVDITLLEAGTPKRRARLRPSKKRLPGCDVSVPSNPPLKAVQEEINSMISAGRFTLGEECAPYALKKFIPNNGQIIVKDVLIYGRKVPLEDIRNRLLKKQERYMRLDSNEAFDAMSHTQLLESLQAYCTTVNESFSDSELQMLLRGYQRGRSLALWHDHATILGSGFILITVHTIYDAAVFLTNAEYEQLHGERNVDVQAVVEQPEIYLLALGSSSVEDQAALVGDRLDCMIQLSSTVVATNGIEVSDTLRFFTGDHPAAQFEQGTQQGGRYKCGACGCKDIMYSDQAHALQCHWRSLQELQELAVGGVYGSKPGATKPFEKLLVAELREELKARGVFDIDRLKPELQQELTEILRGIQRVPALLLENPKQQLGSLNLSRYELMACEPLHDLKGHIHNLLEELPGILPPAAADKCQTLLDSCLSKDKISGADLRRTAIQVFLYLRDFNVQPEILSLLQSIIKVGQILYSSDSRRTPRALLQMYNHCWYHSELCVDLLSKPKKISYGKMFGLYFHALTAHAPTQYELVSLRSVNTENQERLFGQARQIALKCTNRSPNNVIPQVLLHLQAKQEHRHILQSVQTADTQVSHVAQHLPPVAGSTFLTSFIQRRKSSWQAHLERISHFLAQGEGIWWKRVEGGYQFLDGDSDSNKHPAGPELQHFRHSLVRDIEDKRKACWNRIIAERIPIPTDSIKLFNSVGDTTGQLIYRTASVIYVSCSQPQEPITPDPNDDSPTNSKFSLDGRLQDSPSGCNPQLNHPQDNSDFSLDGPDTYHPQDSTSPSQCNPQLNPPQGIPSSNDSPTNSDFSLDGPETQCIENMCVPEAIHVSPTTQQLTNCGQLSPTREPSDNTIPLDIGKEDTVVLIPALQSQATVDNLKTTLASRIFEVIGTTTELVAFDELRYQLKEAKKQKSTRHNFKQLLNKHDNYLAKLTSTILKKETVIKRQIQDFEHKFFFSHGKLPTTSSSEYTRLISSRNHARLLLRNLNVHL